MKKKKILCIGAGIFNITLARKFTDAGYYTEIREKEKYIGGLCYDYYDKEAQTYVSKYGAHILHFDNSTIKALEFLKECNVDLQPYEHKVLCIGNGNLTYFPINRTYLDLYTAMNPSDLATTKLIEEFIESYSMKMWGPSWQSIKDNIKSRYKLKDSYFNLFFEDENVMLPTKGYTNMLNTLLNGVKVVLNKEQSIFNIRKEVSDWDYIFVSAPIDRFFNCKFGLLLWRGLNFKHYKIQSSNNILPTAVVNTNAHPTVLRIVEYNQLYSSKSTNKHIVIETPSVDNKLYPILDNQNLELQEQYEQLKLDNMHFTGRLGRYKYYDMDNAIMEALNLYEKLI